MSFLAEASPEELAYLATIEGTLPEPPPDQLSGTRHELAWKAAERSCLPGVAPADIFARNREPDVVRSRKEAFRYCRDVYRWSTTQIGRVFGNRDASTVTIALRGRKR